LFGDEVRQGVFGRFCVWLLSAFVVVGAVGAVVGVGLMAYQVAKNRPGLGALWIGAAVFFFFLVWGATRGVRSPRRVRRATEEVGDEE